VAQVKQRVFPNIVEIAAASSAGHSSPRYVLQFGDGNDAAGVCL